MPQDRFLIAPFNSGLQTNLKPFMIPDDAFQTLQNAYVFRGRVRKRFGSYYTGVNIVNPQLNSRLAINLGTTDGSGNISGTVPGDVFKVGQLFSIGNEIFTVSALGTPTILLTTGSTITHTYNTTTGAYNFVGATSGTILLFYPAEPVMGLTIYEAGSFNDQPAFAFDTQFAYRYTGSLWARSGTAIWHGTNLNFFWATNWESIEGSKVMFVSNFYAVNPTGASSVTDDPIWYMTALDTWISASGANAFYFLPAGGAIHTGPYVLNSRIILVFKNRLILLNTIEVTSTTNTNYTNRCRYSANASPLLVNAWYEPNQTDSSGNVSIGGGFIDAATDEQIIGAEFIKDRLIVFFQSSTWELVYTGNEIQPFYWQKINTELGAESQNATIPFDKAILTIGNVGVHACNGSNVQRIDDKIPDQIFNIDDINLQVTRVAGIRDYYTEMVYWAFPSDNTRTIYPDQILVYNYQNSTWAIFDDCFTVFGYFEQNQGLTWQDYQRQWFTLDSPWDDGTFQPTSKNIIAGNQQGFVLIISDDVNSNAAAMQISNIISDGNDGANLTIVDHTLVANEYNDYIYILNANGTTLGGIYKVGQVINANTININPAPFTGTYTGGGTVERVSNIQILSKQWNPYLDIGQNMYLNKIEFGMVPTAASEITVDYYPSASNLSMIQEGNASTSIMGTNVLETFPNIQYYPLEKFQERIWHPVFFQSYGECIQIFMYMTPQQMVQPFISQAGFEMDGLILYTERTGRLQ